jgi:hypothetical protein
MAAGATYEPIATYTASSAISSYTFSSIPSTYTDLILINNAQDTSSGPTGLKIRFNGDTNAVYSGTRILGDGTSASSARTTGQTSMEIANLESGNFFMNIIQVQNYSNATTYKTALSRTSLSGYVTSYVGLWRSTAAINSLTVFAQTTWIIGSTFTLYGITAA